MPTKADQLHRPPGARMRRHTECDSMTVNDPEGGGNRPCTPNYIGANPVLDPAAQSQADLDKLLDLPSRKAIGAMDLGELGPVLCAAALRSIQLLRRPDLIACKILKQGGRSWFRRSGSRSPSCAPTGWTLCRTWRNAWTSTAPTSRSAS